MKRAGIIVIVIAAVLIACSAVGNPTVDSETATSISTESAQIGGTLTAGTSADAFICWGTTDGGTESTNDWDHVLSIGSVAQGVGFSTNITGLRTNASFWYRCYVTNGIGSDWSDPAEPFSSMSANADRAVGLNFRHDWQSLVRTNELAGAVFKQGFWNSTANSSNGTKLEIVQPIADEIVDDSGNITPVLLWFDYEGTFSAGSNTPPDNALMNGYLDNISGTATLKISNVTAPAYDVYAYFGSDINDRSGTIRITGRETYSYNTHSGGKLFPDEYIKTTDTGSGYPDANYAVWTNLTSVNFTMVQSKGSGNSGLHALQIVMRPETVYIINQAPGPVTNYTAALNATFGTPGTSNTVYVHWGQVDEGTNMSWENSAMVGSWTNVEIQNVSYTNSSFDDGLRYYYTFRLTNDSGNVWASPSWRFATLGAVPVTTNHSVPYSWLDDQNPAWSGDYEAAATNDHDNDGYSTWEEYWAGTDPQDSNSVFKINAVWFDGTNYVLEWEHANVDVAIPPIAVQRRFDLSTGDWSYVGEIIPKDGTNTWNETPANQAFYRITATNTP